jgi:ribonuclease D
VILVNSRRALTALAYELSRVSYIGVDSESNSFYAYRERTCLLQISTDDADYLVDPIALPELTPLRPVFADPAVCKVFHAAENDIAGLRRDFAIETRGVFDTMAAARILGLPRLGLGDLLLEHFGVTSDKRLQRYEWGRRPLERIAIDYAAMDSRYLLRLRHILGAALVSAERDEEADEEFRRLEGSTSRPRAFDPDSWWRIKGAITLAPGEGAVLRELNAWRDAHAAARDRPPFRIAPDSALLAVARARPRSHADLAQVSDLPSGIAQRHADQLLAAVARGLAAPPPQPRRAPRPDREVTERYEALRHWRRLKAEQRGVLPDVVVSNAVLQVVAEKCPQTIDELEALGLLGPWKLRTYGAELISVRPGAQPGPILRS